MPSMFYIFQHRKKLANELQKRKHENVDCPHGCFFHIEGRTREGAEQVHNGPQQLDPQVLGTQQSSNQDTQAGQSLPRPLSYKPRV